MQRNTSQPLLRAPGVPSDRGHNGQMAGSQDWDPHSTVGMPSGGPMNQQNPMGNLIVFPVNLIKITQGLNHMLSLSLHHLSIL